MARRKDASQKMAAEMQKLFSQLLWTNQNYVDPTNVLNSVVDETGNVLPVGDQQDLQEYLLNFMDRL